MADNPHKGHRERMRKRILDHGMQNLADHELLEILLYYSIPMRDTNPIAHRIINEFGTLSNLLDVDAQTISKREKYHRIKYHRIVRRAYRKFRIEPQSTVVSANIFPKMEMRMAVRLSVHWQK